MSNRSPSRPTPLALDGRAIEAAWWGPEPEAAPTLVLLHEGLGCVALWRNLPARLTRATGCGVFAYSRFGYGASASTPLPRPLDYMRREADEVLPGVLDAISSRRVVLVGHSDGGSIAAICAGSRQDFRIRGLALLAPHFFVERLAVEAIAGTKVAYETGDLRRRLATYHADVECAFHSWNDAWLDPYFAESFDLTADLEHIRVPVLILQGADNPYGTDAHARLAERVCYCPVRTVRLPARHAPHPEAAEQTLAEIARFVARTAAPSPSPLPQAGGEGLQDAGNAAANSLSLRERGGQ
jgi:pimeloyl-ACP methyl ester carboxylesterase